MGVLTFLMEIKIMSMKLGEIRLGDILVDDCKVYTNLGIKRVGSMTQCCAF